MMKKKLVAPMLIGALFAAMMLTGCVTDWPWDEEHPESETAAVVVWGFNGASRIVGYNDVTFEKPVSYGWIFPGDATVIINMSYEFGQAIYKAKGLEFDFSFEAGKIYTIRCARKIIKEGKRIEDKDADRIQGEEWEWGVRIHDYNNGGNRELTEENLIAYVPFKNQPTFRKGLF